MVQIKLANGKTYELRIAKNPDNSDVLTLEFLPGEETLEEIEAIFAAENTAKILLVSEDDETLRIFNGFVNMTNIEKMKNVVIGTEIVDDKEANVTSDVIRITLKKESDMEIRMANLEETVDILVLDSLGL